MPAGCRRAQGGRAGLGLSRKSAAKSQAIGPANPRRNSSDEATDFAVIQIDLCLLSW